ncbi:hypothetical protein PMIN01_11987 [Paraphaeosphaeria minitans]|uniref:Potassium channel tetramerisation-type BTB domain-containing protein n=1 Tax=Paraphaeosphaeria minitans TaxID=565426 RepID=A0A9P6G9B5_9PLEO|nr:hypothetical protein PMIN01_11987 [Paraphaeosphaeria minitans]
MHITIKTPQRSFITDPGNWQGESEYFHKLFSGKWSDKEEDGSYFIGSDAYIFEHILQYLQSGVLPVFYDKKTGHNFPLYQAVLAESRYFAIDRLEKWLCERRYLDAVKINYQATETQDRGTYQKHTTTGADGRTFMVEDQLIDITTSSNMDVTMVPVTQQTNVFYCPDGKHGRSNEEYCRSCIDRARVSVNGGWRNEDQLKWCIVRKEVVVDHDLCVNF